MRIASRVQQPHRQWPIGSTSTAPIRAPSVFPANPEVRIDDDGTGNAVVAILKRRGVQLAAAGEGAATVGNKPDLYPRMRDEAWFHSAEKARNGLVCLSRLDRKTLARLRQQLLAPGWAVDLAEEADRRAEGCHKGENWPKPGRRGRT